MCAAVASQRGRRVLLIDHADQPGKKILISGGGGSTFTNIPTAPDRYLSPIPPSPNPPLTPSAPRVSITPAAGPRFAGHGQTLAHPFSAAPPQQTAPRHQEKG